MLPNIPLFCYLVLSMKKCFAHDVIKVLSSVFGAALTLCTMQLQTMVYASYKCHNQSVHASLTLVSKLAHQK